MAFSTIGAIASAGAALFKGFSAYQQGRYRAAIAKNNAKAARDAAGLERSLGGRRAALRGLQYRQLAGRQAVQFAAGGVAGESVDYFLAGTEKAGQQAQANERYAAELAAWKYDSRAAVFDAEASNARRAGTVGLLGGIVGAGASLAPTFFGNEGETVSAGASTLTAADVEAERLVNTSDVSQPYEPEYLVGRGGFPFGRSRTRR